MMTSTVKRFNDEVDWLSKLAENVLDEDGWQPKPSVLYKKNVKQFLSTLKYSTTLVFNGDSVCLFDDTHQKGAGFVSKKPQDLIIIEDVLASSATLTTLVFGSRRGGLRAEKFGHKLCRNKYIKNVHIDVPITPVDTNQIAFREILGCPTAELSLRWQDGRNFDWVSLGQNRSLRVLSLTFACLSTSRVVPWTTDNPFLETLVVKFRRPQRYNHQAFLAENLAMLIQRNPCISTLIIECRDGCSRLEFAAVLPEFVEMLSVNKCLRTLYWNSYCTDGNAWMIHTLVQPLIPSSEGKQSNATLQSLSLPSACLDKSSLEAVANMLLHNTTLVRLDLGYYVYSTPPGGLIGPAIDTSDVINFLERINNFIRLQSLGVERNYNFSKLQSLGLGGWVQVQGDSVLTALMALVRINRWLSELDLKDTPLQKEGKDTAVIAQLERNKLWKVSYAKGGIGYQEPNWEQKEEYEFNATRRMARLSGSRQNEGMDRATVHQIERNILEEVDSTQLIENSKLGEVSVEEPIDSPKEQEDDFRGNFRAKFSEFTIKDLHEATKGFKNVLGEGGFGKVYEGALVDGMMVAVKELYLNGTQKCNMLTEKSFWAEANTLGSIHHVNLVRLVGMCMEDLRLMLVYEFASNLSLDKWLFGDDLDWKDRVQIAVGIVRGLAYLHFGCQPRVLHLDIKPQNVLLDASKCPKVADFGLARLMASEKTSVSLTVPQGTPGYMAPEVLKFGKVSDRSDVYSFGILLMEIVRGQKNVNKNSEEPCKRCFPMWAHKRLQQGHHAAIVKELNTAIPGFQLNQAKAMMWISLLCSKDAMEERPDMNMVLQMLEGNLKVPKPSGKISKPSGKISKWFHLLKFE